MSATNDRCVDTTWLSPLTWSVVAVASDVVDKVVAAVGFYVRFEFSVVRGTDLLFEMTVL